jgi:hypothetical protein
MKQPVYIVEELSNVVDATRALYGKDLYYLYGHPVEIVQRLQEMSNSKTSKQKKFPLIALFTDIPINVENEGFQGKAILHIIIATTTEPNYTAPQRLEKTFKPILYPIRDLFLSSFQKHRQFTFEEGMKYTTTDRYYWGKQGLYGNDGNMFNDHIDAIELQDLHVNIKNNFC